jgi:hypothetical protein
MQENKQLSRKRGAQTPEAALEHLGRRQEQQRKRRHGHHQGWDSAYPGSRGGGAACQRQGRAGRVRAFQASLGYDVEIVSGAKVFDVRIDANKGTVISSAEDKVDHDDEGDKED